MLSESEMCEIDTNSMNPIPKFTSPQRIKTAPKPPEVISSDIKQNKKKKWTKFKRLPDICYFCETSVLNFGRHLLRSHSHEPEVEKIVILKPNDLTPTKIVAGYDARTEDYTSATFAMNIATSLKECCSLAIRLTLKRRSYNSTIDIAEMEANFKTFQQLLSDSWKFEISTVAASCLNTRKWNKITIVPLASDIKLFRCYLIEKANSALEELKTNPKSEKAYKLLLEVSYCRSMLLNRKRGGELQRLPLHLYQNVPEHQSYEEFNDAISQTEKILMKKFKRVVTRGKRDRGVPVLFTTDVQQHLKELIALRDNFVKKENIYLFPTLHHDTPITGYKVMQKHAKLSGAKNPEAITSTRLRKHLATMSQILELSPNDIEQLATFMGHTKDVHKQVYRLPDDVFQTAKIAKLLVLMESGQAGQYKGKTLDEIDLDLEEDVNEESSDEEAIETREEILEQQEPSTSSVPPKKKRILVPWTPEQKKLAKLYFKVHIQNKVPPKKGECNDLKETHSGVFENKTWEQIKVFIQNIYRNK
ncbi:hypothetical protein JTB14_001881 [Gonioctena quinquepunctata]|nr:hypothetical protein JTB14_001881 [Gonioctena quinquepunctata]